MQLNNMQLDICEKRDVKGMYKKARTGEIRNFTGVQDPYEEPLNPDIIINTEIDSTEIVIKKIISKLHEFQEIKITK